MKKKLIKLMCCFIPFKKLRKRIRDYFLFVPIEEPTWIMQSSIDGPKRIAVQLFGHLRTFRKTFSSFKKKLIEVNKLDGYEIDVFIHTWSKTDHSDISPCNLTGEKKGNEVSEDDMKFIKENYNPVSIEIEEQKDKMRAYYSMVSVNELREKYEKENNVQYDWVLMTRPDIWFENSFRINDYIDEYKNVPELKYLDLFPDYVFTANNIFARMKVADPRHVNEGDLLWFGKTSAMPKNRYYWTRFNHILIDYRLSKDFFIQREGYKC